MWKTAFKKFEVIWSVFPFFKGCLPQILLVPFLNTLTHITVQHRFITIRSVFRMDILNRKEIKGKIISNTTLHLPKKLKLPLTNIFLIYCKPVETGGAEGGGLQPPQIFAKADLLPIDNYSEKKKIARKIQTISNSSKTAGNITLVHFM